MTKYRIKPNTRVDLADYDPNDTSEFEGTKKDGRDEVARLNGEMDELQERLYAESKQAVLFVLQALDTGGKDGVIQKVFGTLNPQGARVVSFKTPNAEELAHDYLWRVHRAMPRRGEIGIFNRSHYEDVLVVRVHKFVPKSIWEKRYDQINAFEKMLTDEGTTIVKFFLHISKEEQRARLQDRIDNPQKHWKFNMNDLRERALWDEYHKAYEEMLSKTSTDWAPWYVVPADHKWYRNIVVARVAHQTLSDLNPKYPETTEDFSKIVIE